MTIEGTLKDLVEDFLDYQIEEYGETYTDNFNVTEFLDEMFQTPFGNGYLLTCYIDETEEILRDNLNMVARFLMYWALTISNRTMIEALRNEPCLFLCHLCYEGLIDYFGDIDTFDEFTEKLDKLDSSTLFVNY